MEGHSSSPRQQSNGPNFGCWRRSSRRLISESTSWARPRYEVASLPDWAPSRATSRALRQDAAGLLQCRDAQIQVRCAAGNIAELRIESLVAGRLFASSVTLPSGSSEGTSNRLPVETCCCRMARRELCRAASPYCGRSIAWGYANVHPRVEPEPKCNRKAAVRSAGRPLDDAKQIGSASFTVLM